MKVYAFSFYGQDFLGEHKFKDFRDFTVFADGAGFGVSQFAGGIRFYHLNDEKEIVDDENELVTDEGIIEDIKRTDTYKEAVK